ncbi:MAG: hypothetical protein ACTSU2_02455 [Promethearchaeota archaeon]
MSEQKINANAKKKMNQYSLILGIIFVLIGVFIPNPHLIGHYEDMYYYYPYQMIFRISFLALGLIAILMEVYYYLPDRILPKNRNPIIKLYKKFKQNVITNRKLINAGLGVLLFGALFYYFITRNLLNMEIITRIDFPVRYFEMHGFGYLFSKEHTLFGYFPDYYAGFLGFPFFTPGLNILGGILWAFNINPSLYLRLLIFLIIFSFFFIGVKLLDYTKIPKIYYILALLMLFNSVGWLEYIRIAGIYDVYSAILAVIFSFYYIKQKLIYTSYYRTANLVENSNNNIGNKNSDGSNKENNNVNNDNINLPKNAQKFDSKISLSTFLINEVKAIIRMDKSRGYQYTPILIFTIEQIMISNFAFLLFPIIVIAYELLKDISYIFLESYSRTIEEEEDITGGSKNRTKKTSLKIFYTEVLILIMIILFTLITDFPWIITLISNINYINFSQGVNLLIKKSNNIIPKYYFLLFIQNVPILLWPFILYGIYIFFATGEKSESQNLISKLTIFIKSKALKVYKNKGTKNNDVKDNTRKNTAAYLYDHDKDSPILTGLNSRVLRILTGNIVFLFILEFLIMFIYPLAGTTFGRNSIVLGLFMPLYALIGIYSLFKYFRSKKIKPYIASIAIIYIVLIGSFAFILRVGLHEDFTNPNIQSQDIYNWINNTALNATTSHSFNNSGTSNNNNSSNSLSGNIDFSFSGSDDLNIYYYKNVNRFLVEDTYSFSKQVWGSGRMIGLLSTFSHSQIIGGYFPYYYLTHSNKFNFCAGRAFNVDMKNMNLTYFEYYLRLLNIEYILVWHEDSLNFLKNHTDKFEEVDTIGNFTAFKYIFAIKSYAFDSNLNTLNETIETVLPDQISMEIYNVTKDKEIILSYSYTNNIKVYVNHSQVTITNKEDLIAFNSPSAGNISVEIRYEPIISSPIFTYIFVGFHILWPFLIMVAYLKNNKNLLKIKKKLPVRK